MASTDRALLNGRYRIETLLGEGAMATVSRAFDVLLGRNVAIKSLKPAYAHDERFVERFYAEARAAARLASPHIVAIYDVLPDASAPAIVMEFVDGPSLAVLLAREQRISEVRAITYARQIARALTAAHAGGVLHRDIKPANVLVARGDMVKVTDFGIAKAMSDADGLALTEPGRLVGTPSYFSPEQAQGRVLTPASDLYSLGVVIYQLVIGSLPFTANSPVSSAVAHVTAPPPSVAELRRLMRPELAAIVGRLLRKDPIERYASADELERALAAIERDDAPHGARWDDATIVGTIPTPQPRRARARLARPAAGTMAIALVLALGFAWTVRSRSAARTDVAHTQSARTSSTSAASPSVTVPNVRGMYFMRARETMLRSGLQATFFGRTADAPANTVIDEAPAPGTPVKRGAQAIVILSTGPQPSMIQPNPEAVPPGWAKHHRSGGNQSQDE